MNIKSTQCKKFKQVTTELLMKILMMIMVMKTKNFSGIAAQRNVLKSKPAHW